MNTTTKIDLDAVIRNSARRVSIPSRAPMPWTGVGCEDGDAWLCLGARRRTKIVYIEIDRCVSDAIQTVTGCKLGRRTLKYVDLGKVAATFLNLETRAAFRIAAKDTSREAVWHYVDSCTNKKMAQFESYQAMPDSELLDITYVCVDVSPQNMPGAPVARVECQVCGEGVNDRREVMSEGRVLCATCADGAYYVVLDKVDTNTVVYDQGS